MKPTHYLVTEAHVSEYPTPINFAKGVPLAIGEGYEGPEGWHDWFFCSTPGQAPGWVPAQVIERLADDNGRAREDYTARELCVAPGDRLRGGRTLNGWVWCENSSGSASGWVPLANLRQEAR